MSSAAASAAAPAAAAAILSTPCSICICSASPPASLDTLVLVAAGALQPAHQGSRTQGHAGRPTHRCRSSAGLLLQPHQRRVNAGVLRGRAAQLPLSVTGPSKTAGQQVAPASELVTIRVSRLVPRHMVYSVAERVWQYAGGGTAPGHRTSRARQHRFLHVRRPQIARCPAPVCRMGALKKQWVPLPFSKPPDWGRGVGLPYTSGRRQTYRAPQLPPRAAGRHARWEAARGRGHHARRAGQECQLPSLDRRRVHTAVAANQGASATAQRAATSRLVSGSPAG